MMGAYEHLLDKDIKHHTWMFFPSGWAKHGDWPDLAAAAHLIKSRATELSGEFEEMFALAADTLQEKHPLAEKLCNCYTQLHIAQEEQEQLFWTDSCNVLYIDILKALLALYIFQIRQVFLIGLFF